MTPRLITEKDIDELARDGVVEVEKGMVVTPMAREYASRKGIRLVYAGGTVPQSESLPRDPKTGQKGPVSDETLLRTVAEEVVKAVQEERHIGGEPVISIESPLRDEDKTAALSEAMQKSGESERAVVVATGVNRPGVAAALTAAISECGADIRDISQTIVSGFFSMIFVVDLTGLAGRLSFKDFKERVEEASKEIGAETAVFHEAILMAMHRV